MRVIENNFNEEEKEATVVVLGSFDGIHCGHEALISEAKKMARSLEAKIGIKVNVMVSTFKNHPLSIVHKEICPKLIMDNKEKCRLFEKLNIDILNFMNFNEEFMKISPEEFISSLSKHFNAKGIVVGFNYRFGYKNLGDVSLLNQYKDEFGYELLIVEPVEINDEVVSSSAIRHYLQEGNIRKANKFLGRPFMLSGEVITGRQIGRTIDFPTLNLNYDKKFIVPGGGVYGSLVEIDGEIYKGITNIGYNPTVHGDKLSIETHVLNFYRDMYGQKVNIYFIEKFRDEKKFKDINELKMQLVNDKNYILNKSFEQYVDKIKYNKTVE